MAREIERKGSPGLQLDSNRNEPGYLGEQVDTEWPIYDGFPSKQDNAFWLKLPDGEEIPLIVSSTYSEIDPHDGEIQVIGKTRWRVDPDQLVAYSDTYSQSRQYFGLNAIEITQRAEARVREVFGRDALSLEATPRAIEQEYSKPAAEFLYRERAQIADFQSVASQVDKQDLPLYEAYLNGRRDAYNDLREQLVAGDPRLAADLPAAILVEEIRVREQNFQKAEMQETSLAIAV